MRPSPVARHFQRIPKQFRLFPEAATTGGSVGKSNHVWAISNKLQTRLLFFTGLTAYRV